MTENIFDRLNKVSHPAATVKVPFMHIGDGEPELVLEIQVMGYGEIQAIEEKATDAFAKKGIASFNPVSSVPFALERARQAWDNLHNHTIGWTHKPKEGQSEPFSKEKLKELFYPQAGLSQYDKFLIYQAYQNAVSEMRAQAEGNENTSAKDSLS